MNTRRQVFKTYLGDVQHPSIENGYQYIKEMWAMERELQYCAIEFGMICKKEWREDFIVIVEKCITQKSWWDTVDFIANEWLDAYFRKFPARIKRVTSKWKKSPNISLVRSSIMFQKKSRERTDRDLLSKFILNVADSDEFFIRKAIGWALREYAKYDPDWVRGFVSSNKLKPLSNREALKHLLGR